MHVRSRKAKLTPPLIALHDNTTSFERATEHAGRQFDLATGEGASYRCRTNRLVWSIAALNQRQRLDLEAFASAEFAQRCDVAASIATEVKVVADDHDRGREAIDQHPLRKNQRILARLFFVEGHDDGCIDAGSSQQFELLVQIGEQQRRAFRSHHRRRVTIESNNG